MRIFITKTDTDLQALSATLLRKPADPGAALDDVRALNPQIEDFQKLAAGTVLLLPDTASIKATAGTTVGTDNLEDLAADVGSGLKNVNSRFAHRLDDLQADHSTVKAALKTAAVKRLVESDPALAKQLDAAEAEYKREQKRLDETRVALAEVQKTALAEFARLQKLLGQ
jgi:hypothetical protein